MSAREDSDQFLQRRTLLLGALATPVLAQPPKSEPPKKDAPKSEPPKNDASKTSTPQKDIGKAPPDRKPDAGVTVEMIERAEWLAGLSLTPDERKQILAGVNEDTANFKRLREKPIDNSIVPAVSFNPAFARPAERSPTVKCSLPDAPPPTRPSSPNDLAFFSVAQLSALIRAREITSCELTKLFLNRLKRFDPLLKCVVTLTEKLAFSQAEAADREIAAGRYRGPLHGIPWGAKDLIAYPGYPTTWGAEPFKTRVLDVKATVAERLENAGAVLLAKLTLGALAMGDKWFGGLTRNPWNPKQGSSGSSAGSASTAAAGLVGFAIGSETLGSIVSPCRVCGATGLRPTFGRVSRHGCMALSWTMDKIGPIARTVEDCALVFAAIAGADGRDPTAVTRSFTWPCPTPLNAIRVGYFKTGRFATKDAELDVLKKLGVELVPIELPPQSAASSLLTILSVEAATAFDEITRKKITASLNDWPRIFRAAQFVTGVEYLRASRLRTQLCEEMSKVFEKVDCYIGGNDLAICNLTGHPTVVMPHTFIKRDDLERPSSITFTGDLFAEDKLLALAHAFQLSTNYHLRHPSLKEAPKG